ncbi:MAG TPA: hypothetical protein VFD04_25315 [Actinomycetes bacterium]|nr:hypothetical protein [Actinomycetes bacterium]
MERDASDRRGVLVQLEAAAVWHGLERGVVTGEEARHRLDELERLLWHRTLAAEAAAYANLEPAGG